MISRADGPEREGEGKSAGEAGGDPLAWLGPALAELASAGLDREPTTRPGPGAAGSAGLLDFSSNDYLGLSEEPRVVEAAREAAARHGAGARASALVSGRHEPHEELERALAEFEGTEAALLFPTGYAANLGTIAALAGPGDAVYVDRLNHACLVDGARLSGASTRVYPHRDADRLAGFLERDRASNRFRRTLIATDGVFSMDGTLAPLGDLARIAARAGAALVVDEAHGTGVFGASGRGACEAAGLEPGDVHVKVGTLSKALGSAGGFVAGSERLIRWLRNRARTQMFSTAMTPAAAAAAREALRLIREEPERRRRLHELGDELRAKLRRAGWNAPESTGPIVPLLVGAPERAVELSRALRASGILAPAIRPPTVPSGTARLRLTVTARHRSEDVDRLIEALAPHAPGA